MENKNIIIILSIVVVILAIVASLFICGINPFDPYKDVDANYVCAPLGGEKVRFTGTYLGPDESRFNFDQKTGVIQVGSSYVIINTDKVQGLEGKTITVEGYFVNDKIEGDVVYVNNEPVYGENFCLEKVLSSKNPTNNKDSQNSVDKKSSKSTSSEKSKSWESIGSYSGSGTGSESIKIPSGKIKIELSAYPIKNYATNHLYVTGSNGESAGVDWGSTSAVETRFDSLTYTSSSEETFDIDYYETVSWEVNIYRYQ